MTKMDIKDIAAGGLMIAIGLFFALFATTHYNLGTLGRMGPGMLPTIAGWILVGLGSVIMLPAFFRHGTAIGAIEWRPAITILLACMVFALCLERFGIVPATAAIVLISTFADSERKMSPVVTAVFVAGVAALITLIFKVGLDIPVAIVRWGF